MCLGRRQTGSKREYSAKMATPKYAGNVNRRLTNPRKDRIMAGEHITAEEARERLAYDAQTGALTWLTHRSSSRIGRWAKCLDVRGYVQVNIKTVVYKGHRLAWLIHYGEWPDGDIDHINGIRDDNRIANLRAVSNRVNCQNKGNHSARGAVGLLGVHYYAGKWAAKIHVGKKQIYLGRFNSADLAHAAYVEAKRKYHEGCTI